jgi:hypothetical protein
MEELINWLKDLDPIFAFLLALPFIVAAAAGIGEAARYLWRARQEKPRQQRAKLSIQTDKAAWR